jgi:hypothetical protein
MVTRATISADSHESTPRCASPRTIAARQHQQSGMDEGAACSGYAGGSSRLFGFFGHLSRGEFDFLPDEHASFAGQFREEFAERTFV